MRSIPNKAHLWKEASHPKSTLVNKHVVSLYFFECVWIYSVKVLQYVLWNPSNTLLSPYPSGARMCIIFFKHMPQSRNTSRSKWQLYGAYVTRLSVYICPCCLSSLLWYVFCQLLQGACQCSGQTNQPVSVHTWSLHQRYTWVLEVKKLMAWQSNELLGEGAFLTLLHMQIVEASRSSSHHEEKTVWQLHCQQWKEEHTSVPFRWCPCQKQNYLQVHRPNGYLHM